MTASASRPDRRLSGRVCVVAGADGPLGRAVAERLAREGGTVAGIDRRPHAVGVPSLEADLAREDEVRDAFARIHGAHGRIDVLYNNVGAISPDDGSALDTDEATLEAVLSANFRTAWLCCKHAIPYMLANVPPGGSVINAGSFLAGMGAATGQMAYNAAKAAVVQLSRDLGTQLARRGVRVNALALGPIETPQLRAVFDRLGEEERRRRFRHMPLGRFGTPDELAGTVAYLASDESGFVTASVFPLDGGIQGAFTVPGA